MVNRTGPLYWASVYVEKVFGLHLYELLGPEDQALLRRWAPLPMSVADMNAFENDSSLGNLFPPMGSPQLAHQEFLIILEAVGHFVSGQIESYLDDRVDIADDKSDVNFDNSPKTLARAAKDMATTRDKIFQVQGSSVAWARIEREMMNRLTHFRQLKDQKTFPIEELGLIYSYLVMHPHPMEACEFIAANFKTNVGVFLVKTRLSLEKFEDVLNYVVTHLKNGKLTGLMMSLTPWNTPDFDGISSLAEEALRYFSIQEGLVVDPDSKETWIEPLYNLFDSHKLLSSLYGMVDGGAVTGEMRKLAAMLLRKYSPQYKNRLVVIDVLGIEGKKKKDKGSSSSKGDKGAEVGLGASVKKAKPVALSAYEKIFVRFAAGQSLQPKEEKELMSGIKGVEVVRLLPLFSELSQPPQSESEKVRRVLILRVLRETVHVLFVDHTVLVKRAIPNILRSLSLADLAELRLNSAQKTFVSIYSQSKKKGDFAVELLFDTQLEKSQRSRDVYFEIVGQIIENSETRVEQEQDVFLAEFLPSMLARNFQSVRTVKLFLNALKRNLISDDFFHKHLSQYLAVPLRSLEDYEIEFFLSCSQLLRSPEFADLEWSLEELGWVSDSGSSTQELSRKLRRDRRLRSQDAIQKNIMDSLESDGVDDGTRSQLNSITDTKGMRAVEIFARAHRFLLQDVSDVWKKGYDFILVHPKTGMRHYVELKTSAYEDAKVHISPNQIRVSSQYLPGSVSSENVEYSILVVKAGNFEVGGIREFIWYRSPDLASTLDNGTVPPDGVNLSLKILEQVSSRVDRFNLN